MFAIKDVFHTVLMDRRNCLSEVVKMSAKSDREFILIML